MSEKRFEYDKCTGIKDLSIDEDDDQFLYPTQIVEILNEQQSTIQRFEEYINKLQEEIAFWKKWALEYLTNYDIYTDEFLETLESIEGEEIVQRIRERQNEIIKILEKEELL